MRKTIERSVKNAVARGKCDVSLKAGVELEPCCPEATQDVGHWIFHSYLQMTKISMHFHINYIIFLHERGFLKPCMWKLLVILGNDLWRLTYCSDEFRFVRPVRGSLLCAAFLPFVRRSTCPGPARDEGDTTTRATSVSSLAQTAKE